MKYNDGCSIKPAWEPWWHELCTPSLVCWHQGRRDGLQTMQMVHLSAKAISTVESSRCDGAVKLKQNSTNWTGAQR